MPNPTHAKDIIEYANTLIPLRHSWFEAHSTPPGDMSIFKITYVSKRQQIREHTHTHVPLASLLAGERILAFAREDAGYVPLMILIA